MKEWNGKEKKKNKVYGFPFLHILCYQRWFSRIPIEPCYRSIKELECRDMTTL
jgi:hypothetical protein